MDIVHSLTLTCAYEKGWPSAPPPSPSLGGKRRHLGITPISAVLDRCCEELKEKVDKMDITDGETNNLDFENDLPIKRTRTEYAVTNFYSNCTRKQQFSKEASYGPRPSSNCGENFFIPHDDAVESPKAEASGNIAAVSAIFHLNLAHKNLKIRSQFMLLATWSVAEMRRNMDTGYSRRHSSSNCEVLHLNLSESPNPKHRFYACSAGHLNSPFGNHCLERVQRCQLWEEGNFRNRLILPLAQTKA